jgi:hypothetical protein
MPARCATFPMNSDADSMSIIHNRYPTLRSILQSQEQSQLGGEPEPRQPRGSTIVSQDFARFRAGWALRGLHRLGRDALWPQQRPRRAPGKHRRAHRLLLNEPEGGAHTFTPMSHSGARNAIDALDGTPGTQRIRTARQQAVHRPPSSWGAARTSSPTSGTGWWVRSTRRCRPSRM